MLSAITEGADDSFSLLIRVEKAQIASLQSKVTQKISELACVEIRHVQQHLHSKISPRQQTYRIDATKLVWMQDFFFEHVSSTDQFLFTVLDDKYQPVAQHKQSIQKLMPFLDTGQLVQQAIPLASKQVNVGELFVSFSLYEGLEPIAGVFPFQLSLNTSNQSWATKNAGKSTESKPMKNWPLCSCWDGDRIEGFTELQNVGQRTQSTPK